MGSSVWRKYSVSPHTDQEPYHRAGKLYLTKLQLATAYQARVRCHNKEGMSDWSHLFTFATRGGGEEAGWHYQLFIHLFDVSEPKQEQMTQSSAGVKLLTPALIISILSFVSRFI